MFTAKPNRIILPLVVVVLGCVIACSGPSTVATANGAHVYEQKCAACHGNNGQGVEGKYAEALYGDRPLPKLARYIHQNMPDDHPETLSLPEAQAVATYVYDAFYSPPAQARLHPTRIELAHLSNPQLVTTVADLLRSFVGPDVPATPGVGLNATYYNSAQRGRFEASKVVHKGIDAQVDFEFTESSPVRQQIGAAEFSMQWRGAVLADESGDYEFVVRTPNTVRVWLNADVGAANPVDAVIDANVSNPQHPDYRVTVRLIGGRSYPIAIDYWALAEKPGAPPPAFSLRWRPPHGSERPIPTRNLSPSIVKPTFVVATRFSADDSSQGYERSVSVSKAWDEATTGVAFEVANQVVKKLDQFARTRAGEATRPQKVEAFAERFVATAFRRPLSADEKTLYITERFKDAPDLETAIKRVVLLTLKSPQFLYVDLPHQTAASTSAGASATDDFAIAARLSFALWDSLPDAELTAAAASGRLHSRGEIVAQATRMLGDPRARAKLREFFHQWLQLRYIEDLRKDGALYPDFTADVIDDLRTSLNLFLDEVAWNERSDFRELLRADYVVANERLAKFYGWPAPQTQAGDFGRVSALPGQRSGVLTHPYLLAAFAYKNSSSPIHRGVFLTRNIVGRSLKPPPMAVSFNEAEFAPDLTMREKVVRLTKSETCQGCHSVINPLGFSLESYDAVGRFRTEENGRPVDPVSDYLTDDNRTVRLAGARDVADFAIGSERANEAFIEQLFHHVTKQPVPAYGLNTLAGLRDSFIASDYNLQKLLIEIATVHAARDLALPTFAAAPRSP